MSEELKSRALRMAAAADGAPSRTDAAERLLELAEREFGVLSTAEERLFEAAASGLAADLGANSADGNDPAAADAWGQERALKADRIAWLCTNPEALSLVSPQGIWVRGVRVDGGLRLAFARIPFPLLFTGSAFPGDICLSHAEIRALSLPGTHTCAIQADGLNVDGSVFLRDGFRAEGEVRFLGATIRGDFTCDKGQFINPKGVALAADGMKVGGNVFLRHGFTAEGEVRLAGGRIGGQLNCESGRFTHPEGYALNANSVEVGGDVFLRDSFRAEGEVRFRGASVGGHFNCNTGQILHGEGYALSADGLSVKGSVFLGFGFKAEGRVSFADATIGRQFVWTQITEPERTTLDLRSARIGTLWDDTQSWPGKGKALLHGLVYDEIYERAPLSARARIDWLERQPEYHPQPYAQLATVLRKLGREEDAKKVLIAKESHPGRLAGLTWLDRVMHRALGVTMRYGYRPWRLAWFGLLVVLVGWGVFRWGASPGPGPRTGREALASVSTEGVASSYSTPSALMYSLDVFLPLVDLQQERQWVPNLRGTGRISTDDWALLISGKTVRTWMWFEILAGWALSALFVAAITRLVRRKYEP